MPILDGDIVEITVLIKAAPEIGDRHGETVCVAGIDAHGNWHRLYPVPFKDLEQRQQFSRWDVLKVRWRKPTDDDRVESKRIFHSSAEVVKKLSKSSRHLLAQRALVPSLETEMAEGRSLALIRPENPRFRYRRLTEKEIAKSEQRRRRFHDQADMFSQSIVALEAPPYEFRYEFEHGGRSRRHVCIDWETEQTFLKWRRLYGEAGALKRMSLRWGEEYPELGVAFAMGTHRVKMFKSWLLSGIIRVDHTDQASLF